MIRWQPMAGGEVLFGLSGFSPLIRQRAVDTIMPDVKHCGGLLELTRIAAMAANEGVFVDGMAQIPERPGFGVALNEDVKRARSQPL